VRHPHLRRIRFVGFAASCCLKSRRVRRQRYRTWLPLISPASCCLKSRRVRLWGEGRGKPPFFRLMLSEIAPCAPCCSEGFNSRP